MNEDNLEIIKEGAKDIEKEASSVVTIKCNNCGAEIVVDTFKEHQIRCHWCRNYLSIDKRVANGLVPDGILPFNVERDEAYRLMKKFISKRKLFAKCSFIKSFKSENIMGVYFPYMLIDSKGHSLFVGEGEQKIRKYSENERDYYDAKLYHLEREFDFSINGLSVEARLARLDNYSTTETNNIINSILPFDTDNIIKYSPNYLKGYSSEKRDMNIDEMRETVEKQIKDISRYSMIDTLDSYDRGVTWLKEEVDIKEQLWQTAYFPVWLYSFREIKKNKTVLHYVIVNARTQETNGSVPMSYVKCGIIFALVELVTLLITILINAAVSPLIAVPGCLFLLFIFLKYRNISSRHFYEDDTEKIFPI